MKIQDEDYVKEPKTTGAILPTWHEAAVCYCNNTNLCMYIAHLCTTHGFYTSVYVFDGNNT